MLLVGPSGEKSKTKWYLIDLNPRARFKNKCSVRDYGSYFICLSITEKRHISWIQNGLTIYNTNELVIKYVLHKTDITKDW